MRNHGTDPRQALGAHARADRGDEGDLDRGRGRATTASYVDFERIWSWPKPAQDPHPPVLVGGNGPTVLDRVVAFGDEWMPNTIEVDELRGRMDRLGEMADEAGRPQPRVGLYAAPAQAAEMAAYDAIGISRYVLFVPPVPRPEAEARLDHLAGVIEEYRAGGS